MRKDRLLKKRLFVTIPAIVFICLAIISLKIGGIIAAIVIGLIAFFKLDNDYEPIEDAKIRTGWALIMASEFLLCRMISDSPWLLVIASVICILTYTYAPVITDRLGLERCDGPNTPQFWLVFFACYVAAYSFFYFIETSDNKLDEKFARSKFVEIVNIEKETYDGNTYYVVTTEKGELVGVDARRFPEIRKAQKGQKIKYTFDIFYNDGMKRLYKLEIE